MNQTSERRYLEFSSLKLALFLTQAMATKKYKNQFDKIKRRISIEHVEF